MKKYWFIAIASIIFFSSCKKFLQLEPKYVVNTASFYKTEQDFETAIVGSYSQLQPLYNASMIYLGELTTDNAHILWTSPTTSESELDEMRITPSNGFVGNVWNWDYKIITESNTILDNIDNTGLRDALKEQYKGEAKFLRAFAYFNLVRLFGDLPIVTHNFRSPKEIQSYDMSRKPADSVYAIIIDDLQQASSELQGVTGLSKSRASVGAAKTLLGKVYLTRHQYAEAAAVLGDVISSGTYSLQQDYASLFTNKNDELPESVFEIKYLSGNIGEGNSFSSIFTPPSFNAAIFPNNMNGSGRIIPTRDMMNAYEPGDIRRKKTIMDSLRVQGGKYEPIPYGLKLVDFTVGIPGDGGVNYIALRYADVLLMYAEALNESDKTDDAYTYINKVRERAGLNDLSGLTKNQFRTAMEREQRVEFFCEGYRWFDLVRTGRAITVIDDYFNNNGLSFSVTQNELLMPIPQRETDINPNLKQNPGY